MGYWRDVFKEGARLAGKAIGIESTERLIVALAIHAATAALAYYLTGQQPTALIAVAATFAFWPLLLFWKVACIPPKKHAAQKAEIERLNGELAKRNATPDLKAIHNLLMQFAVKFLKMRIKKGVTPQQQRQWATEFLNDMEVIFGPEMVLNLRHKYPHLVADKSDAAAMDATMRALSGAMTEFQEGLAIERVSTESEDVNGYVKRRLGELRTEQGFR